MAEERDILENTVVLSILKYICYFILIATGFVVTKYLGPAGFGLYSALVLILKYSVYSFMPFYSACYKKISYYKGQEKFSKIQWIRDSTFAPSILLSLTLAIIVFISSFFSRDSQMILGLRLISLLVLLQHMYYFYGIYLRTDKRFTLFGTVELTFYAIRLALVLLFLKFLKPIWVLTAVAIAYAAALLLGLIIQPYKFRLKFKFADAKKMFKFGLPTTLLGAMGTIFTSVDKLMIIAFLNKTLLGLYSFAILVLELITFIPANISIITLPSLLERHGAKTGEDKLRNMFTLPIMIVSYLLPIIIGGAFFYSKPVIVHIFPNYLTALNSLYIITFGAFFLANLFLLENYIITLDREKKILIPKIIFIIFAIILNYLAIIKGFDIIGVAFATTLTYTLYFVYLIFYTYNTISKTKTELLFNVLKIVFPFIYTICLVIVFSTLIADSGFNLILQDFVSATIRYCLFLICNIPLWYYLNKKTGFIRFIYQQLLQILGFDLMAFF